MVLLIKKVLITAHIVVRVQVLARDVLCEMVLVGVIVINVVGRLRSHGVHCYPVDAQGWSVDVDVERGACGVHDQQVAGGVDGKGVVGVAGACVWEVSRHSLEPELALLRAPGFATEKTGTPSDLNVIVVHTVHIRWKEIP